MNTKKNYTVPQMKCFAAVLTDYVLGPNGASAKTPGVGNNNSEEENKPIEEWTNTHSVWDTDDEDI